MALALSHHVQLPSVFALLSPCLLLTVKAVLSICMVRLHGAACTTVSTLGWHACNVAGEKLCLVFETYHILFNLPSSLFVHVSLAHCDVQTEVY